MSDSARHRFVLIRHAEAVCNVLGPDATIETYDADAPLTPRGRSQADALARRLPDELIDSTLFCSPLRRARDTAAPLVRRRALTIEYEPRLAEMAVAQPFVPPLSLAAWDALLERRVAEPNREVAPGMEPLVQQDARVRHFLRARHATRGDAKCTLLIAHAFTIELAVLALLGMPLTVLATFRLRLSNTGVHLVENDALGGPARLLLVNAKNHLGQWL